MHNSVSDLRLNDDPLAKRLIGGLMCLLIFGDVVLLKSNLGLNGDLNLKLSSTSWCVDFVRD